MYRDLKDNLNNVQSSHTLSLCCYSGQHLPSGHQEQHPHYLLLGHCGSLLYTSRHIKYFNLHYQRSNTQRCDPFKGFRVGLGLHIRVHLAPFRRRGTKRGGSNLRHRKLSCFRRGPPRDHSVLKGQSDCLQVTYLATFLD